MSDDAQNYPPDDDAPDLFNPANIPDPPQLQEADFGDVPRPMGYEANFDKLPAGATKFSNGQSLPILGG